MFCSKCGTKVVESAVFCPICGAKLIQDNEGEQVSDEVTILPEEAASKSAETPDSSTELITEAAQNVNFQGKISSRPEKDADTSALLKENIGMCSAIKSVKQVKKGVVLRGKIYRHTVKVITEHIVQARVRSLLTFPFSILYGVLAGLFCFITGIILAEFVKYKSICWEYYHGILLALFCLFTGVIVLIHTFGGRKEKDAVETYVRKILEPKQINLSKELLKIYF